jgi:hypothetical protein
MYIVFIFFSSTVDCDIDEEVQGSNVGREETPTREDLLPATPIPSTVTTAASTPAAPATTTSATKPGRKRSKAVQNNTDNANDRTSLSGSSSAKRTRR